jgi:hypothetical protein
MSLSRRILTERMGSIPASMQMSQEMQKKLVDSFGNIFKSIWSSAKLLGRNLLFNAQVVIGAMDGDQEKVNKAFKDFAAARKQFAKESDENLKYYREAFYETTTDAEGNSIKQMRLGPKLLVGIGSPLLLPAMAYQPGRGFDGKVDDPIRVGDPKNTNVKPTSVASDRLERALKFFEFGKKSGLNEQKAPGGQVVPVEAQQEKAKLQQIAQSFVNGEKARGQQLLDMILGRIAFFKKVVDAKSVEEFEAAASSAQAQGVKMSTRGIIDAKTKIEQEAKKLMTEKPEEFKTMIANARSQFPDIDQKDDLKALSELSFRMSKSDIQQQLSSSFENLINSAKKTMYLPLDEQMKVELSKFPTGQQYLAFLTSFEQQLETGEKQLQAAAGV